MANYFDNKQQAITRYFTIAWLILTLILLVTLGFYQKQQLKPQLEQQLQLAAKDYQEKLDHFFERLLTPTHHLDLNANCRKKLLPQLEAIDFENPSISALVVSDKHNHILCATTEHEIKLPPPATDSPSLLGPLHKTIGDNGTYLLQKQILDYYYGAFILGKIISRHLNTNPLIKAVALELSDNKKIIYYDNEFNLANKNLVRQPLEFINNMNLVVIPNEKPLIDLFLIRVAALLTSCLLLSFLIYFYIRRRLMERFTLSAAIASALQQQQFKPIYMPTWDEKKHTYTGAEVLMRWHVNDDDIIPPDVFIHEAEQSGLIVPMTVQLIKETLKESEQFLKERPDFHLSFNLSSCHFSDASFFEKVYELFQQYEIKPSQIMFELTERELLDEVDEQLKKRLHLLVSDGFSLAIDDFGTGHASINYLRHFPFTHLKIDKIFIQSIGTGAITESLSTSIIQLAKTIQMHLIAEGVETKEQYDYLKKNEVNFMQGWYFSKAIPLSQLEQLIDKGKS